MKNLHICTDRNEAYGLKSLKIDLPFKWRLDTNDKLIYSFIDENGENVGWIMSISYRKDFEFRGPNHSTLVKKETLSLPIGSCSLITLDADNGTAASGITGTHNVYYGIISSAGKAIYIIRLDRNDKSPKTKEQFIEIIKNLRSLD